MSLLLELFVLLAAIALGARVGGVGMGLWGGVGLAILVFVFGETPGNIPGEVLLIILTVIMAASAMEAAGGIHTDLARGFIRAETMTLGDLVRLGSEREIKAAGLVRQEPKDYVIKDDDVINIKHN